MTRILCNIILICFFLFSGCQENLGDCFKRTGSRINRAYDTDAFHTLYIQDGLDVVLAQGNEYKVTVEAGSHIISEIKVRVTEDTLRLNDEISCDWARKYESKKVTVQSPDLRTIYQNGYGHLTAENTLTYDTLFILPRYGQGDVTLELDSKYLWVESHRNGTVTLSGKTDFLRVDFLDNNAIFDGRALQAKRIHMIQKCNNSLHLYPVLRLEGRLLEKGNVYLYHTPEEMEVEITGQGVIIDKTEDHF